MSKILYHGTTADFSEVTLEYAKSKKDFGIGFYTTDKLQHACAIANKTYSYGYIPRYVYSFKIDMTELRKNLVVKEFIGSSLPWLEYISYNRIFNPTDIDFDVVIGPTADARTQYIITQECLGYLSTEGKLKLPKDKIRYILNTLTQTGLSSKLGTQYCFKSHSAIDYLNRHKLERRHLKQ